MELIELARALAHVPDPYGVGGAQQLWGDEHVQRQMLASHLDADLDGASPPHAFIDRAVAWIVATLHLNERHRVLDLGCGPGLFATRLAAHGVRVHGIDLSAVSVAEARRRAPPDLVSIEVGNYLDALLPTHDLALLIGGDYGVLSPQDRHRLLTRVRARLVAGGHLLVEVPAPARYATLEPGCVIAERLMEGFWAPGQYVGIHQTMLYDEVRVALDRYTIIEPTRTRIVHNWLGHLDVDQARGELEACGLRVTEVLGDVSGAPFDPDAPQFALLATAD